MEQKKINKSKVFRKFLKFSGIGVQLGVMMYLASLLGEKVDDYYRFEKPWTSLFFIIIALIVFVWNLMRQLKKLNNE